MRYSRKLLFASAMAASIVLTGSCNNQPNTSRNAGPTILLTIVPAGDFKWPTNTPGLTNNGLHILATSANKGGTISWAPGSSTPPTYDWLMILSPGDTSGIRSLTAQVGFFSDCGGQGSSAFPATPWGTETQTYGSSGGPVMAYPPIFAVELSPKVIGPYPCSTPNGTSVTGGEVGLYYAKATSTNGNGKTTNAGFEIKIGNVDGINIGS